MSSKVRNLIAIAVGILLAGAPIAGLNFWVDGLLVRQSANDVDTFARRSINLAETRLSSVLAALDTLAGRGVDGCRPDQVEALKQAALSEAWVKQFAVLGAAGQPLCSDFALPKTDVVKVLSSRNVLGSSAAIEVVQVGDRPGRMIRLRRPVGPGGTNSLAALILAGRPDRNGRTEHVRHSELRAACASRRHHQSRKSGPVPPDSEALSAVTRNARVSDRFGLRVATSHPQIEGEVSLNDLR